jgi:FkbM family methyltransferase
MEVDCFLSVLTDIRSPEVTLMELGAGYGEWCLALTGVIKNHLIPTTIKTIQCYAIEAEPTHKNWCKTHFDVYNIPGKVVWGAVSDYNGDCRFSILPRPADNYGQSITVGNGLLRTISNVARHKAVLVPCFTLDKIISTCSVGHVDVIHMDVQGAECRVINGAMKTIEAGKIDYWIIGTHGRSYSNTLPTLLKPYYENILSLHPNSINSRVICQDGIQVYKRREM